MRLYDSYTFPRSLPEAGHGPNATYGTHLRKAANDHR